MVQVSHLPNGHFELKTDSVSILCKDTQPLAVRLSSGVELVSNTIQLHDGVLSTWLNKPSFCARIPNTELNYVIRTNTHDTIIETFIPSLKGTQEE